MGPESKFHQIESSERRQGHPQVFEAISGKQGLLNI